MLDICMLVQVRWSMGLSQLYLCEDSKIDNGDLRVYDLSSFKVLRAVKGNGNMVSSIICVKRPGSEFRDAWVASGKQVCICFFSSIQMWMSYPFLNRSLVFNWVHRKWYKLTTMLSSPLMPSQMTKAKMKYKMCVIFSSYFNGKLKSLR